MKVVYTKGFQHVCLNKVFTAQFQNSAFKASTINNRQHSVVNPLKNHDLAQNKKWDPLCFIMLLGVPTANTGKASLGKPRKHPKMAAITQNYSLYHNLVTRHDSIMYKMPKYMILLPVCTADVNREPPHDEAGETRPKPQEPGDQSAAEAGETRHQPGACSHHWGSYSKRVNHLRPKEDFKNYCKPYLLRTASYV